MPVTIDGTTGVTTPGISNSEGYSGDGLSIAAGAPAGAVAIDASGNLGLGVTPSAWDATYKTLQVGSRSMFFGAGNETCLANNAYFNGGYKYVQTNSAGLYIMDRGTHTWYNAPSGTAGNAITFTQAMTLDASGDLTLPGTFKLGNGNQTLAAANTNDLQLNASNGSGNILFRVAGSERARIDSSGNLLVGTTSFNAGTLNSVTKSGYWALALRDNVGNGALIEFKNSSNTQVGTVQTNGTTTSYNTSSDYRLKENIQPMTGALAKVAALKPVTYTWKADGSAGEGFIAHELAEVCPAAVTGEKDAVDAEGNPVYQGIDTSFLVATLTAAIQELNAKVEAQAAEIAALKGKA